MGKEMWYDDVNTISYKICDFISDELKINIPVELENRLMDFIFEKLDPYSVGDYASHH